LGGGSYEIRLAGRLSDSVLAAFECEARGLSVSVEPAEMVLYGPVQDQAALWGLLDRILSSGLEVVEVRRLPIPRRNLDSGLARGCLSRSGAVRISSYFRSL
jgi:hypothetical protein